MANIVWADVVNHASALANPAVSVPAQTDLLGWANNLLNVRVFGGENSVKYKLARIYLVAHFATLDVLAAAAGLGGGSTGGTTGPVTSESEGGLSRSYGGAGSLAGSSDSSWNATIYGQMYAIIAGTCPRARLPFLCLTRPT